MSENELPEWCQVGRQVAVLKRGTGRSSGNDVELTTISKIGKRDIVLANGTRFNRNNLYGGAFAKYGDTWAPSLRLHSIGNPAVVEALVRKRRHRVKSEVEIELRTWVMSGDPVLLDTMIEQLKAELELERTEAGG